MYTVNTALLYFYLAKYYRTKFLNEHNVHLGSVMYEIMCTCIPVLPSSIYVCT